MSIKEILDYLSNGGIITIAVLTLVQISPLKLNPWKKIGEIAGKALADAVNGPVMEELWKDKAEVARYRIIQFSDEIMLHRRHSENSFDQILGDIKVYQDYCKAHPDYPNGKAMLAIETAQETYKHCVRTGDFLTPQEVKEEQAAAYKALTEQKQEDQREEQDDEDVP